MSLNFLTYFIYGLLSAVIIIYVGKYFYTHGALYLHNVFSPNLDVAQRVNILLLIGYYLVNLGGITVSLTYWPPVDNYLQLLELVSFRIGLIMCVLAVLHFFNLFWVHFLNRYINT